MADSEDLVDAWVSCPGMSGAEANLLPEDITKYETERRAYLVSSLVDQLHNKETDVWKAGWKEADVLKAVNEKISRDYHVTEQNPGAETGHV
ncbi:MAG TPA: hypothetical protein VI756_11570 [Blastocatellia bacterium]